MQLGLGTTRLQDVYSTRAVLRGQAPVLALARPQWRFENVLEWPLKFQLRAPGRAPERHLKGMQVTSKNSERIHRSCCA